MKKSTYIVLLVIMLVFGLTMFILLGIPNIKKERASSTIIVGDNTIWNYDSEKWTNITEGSSISSLNWEEFHVYEDNKYLGKYLLWHDDKWYIFDKNKKAINYSGKLLAYKSNYDIKLNSFNVEDVSINNYIIQVLNDYNISSNSTLTTSSVIHTDINNDGVDDDIYLISNAFTNDEVDKNFTIVFMVSNNKIYDIYNNISSYNYYNGCRPYITAIGDLDGDSNNELILSCGKYSLEEESNMLYKYNEDGFQLLISNNS